MDDANWIVRRQLAATLGTLPQAAKLAPMANLLEKFGADEITVDIAISGLSGQEVAMLDRLLGAKITAREGQDAVSMLAAAISRGRDAASAGRLFDLAAESDRAMWQRVALLRGADQGLPGVGLGRGGGGGGAVWAAADWVVAARRPV